MKMVINAVSAKMGGAVTYLTNLLRHLPSPESGHEFCVLLPPETARRLNALPKNAKLVPTNIGDARWWERFWWEQVTLRRYLRKVRAESLFSTANFSMFRCPVRQILLVRNALYFSRVYRERFLPRHTWRFRLSFALQGWLCRRSIRWADVVMAPTQAMLDDVRQFVRLEERKAVVNPYGVILPERDSERAPGRAVHAERGTVRLLYVSLYSEHKNVRTLLRALPMLNSDGVTRFVLKTTADPGWRQASWTSTASDDQRMAKMPEVAPWVEFVGPLRNSETRRLYETADIFVFPALTESFGHPLAEAMAYGLPIVASDTPVNREMCGTAAIYFNPLDPGHLAQAIQRVAAETALRSQLGLQAWLRARARFSWNGHLRTMLEIAQGKPVDDGRARQEALREEWEVREAAMSENTAKVSVLVLTYNEEANIAQCLQSVRWAEEVFVVDSLSPDRTVEIAKDLGAKVYSHVFEGYTKQRNWALDNLPFSYDWILILDADECIPLPLAEEVRQAINSVENNSMGFYLNRRFFFMGRWLKHGGLYPSWILRLFKRGAGRFDDRPLNEHVLLSGRAGYLKNPLDHKDQRPLSDWILRHNRYAELEAGEYLQEKRRVACAKAIPARLRGSQAERKRWVKLHLWNRLPLFLRPFVFFVRNYFLRVGFLDGKPGFIYHVLWSFWYPFLTSAKILERRSTRASARGVKAAPVIAGPAETLTPFRNSPG